MKYHDRMIEIARSRERLLARCEAQRGELAALSRQWEGPLNVVDRVVAGVNHLRNHPVVLGVLIALLVVVRRRGLWSWARRGLTLWRAYRAVRNAASRLAV